MNASFVWLDSHRHDKLGNSYTAFTPLMCMRTAIDVHAHDLAEVRQAAYGSVQPDFAGSNVFVWNQSQQESQI